MPTPGSSLRWGWGCRCWASPWGTRPRCSGGWSGCCRSCCWTRPSRPCRTEAGTACSPCPRRSARQPGACTRTGCSGPTCWKCELQCLYYNGMLGTDVLKMWVTVLVRERDARDRRAENVSYSVCIITGCSGPTCWKCELQCLYENGMLGTDVLKMWVTVFVL